MKKLIALSATTAMAACSLHVLPAQASQNATAVTYTSPSITEFVYYDLRTDQFGIDEQHASAKGVSDQEIANASSNLAAISPDEARFLMRVLGADPDALRQQRAIPAVILRLVAFVGASFAEEMMSQVSNWGISGACRNLRGKNGIFDDFCRSNGHI